MTEFEFSVFMWLVGVAEFTLTYINFHHHQIVNPVNPKILNILILNNKLILYPRCCNTANKLLLSNQK
jgi:hypothetical protein